MVSRLRAGDAAGDGGASCGEMSKEGGVQPGGQVSEESARRWRSRPARHPIFDLAAAFVVCGIFLLKITNYVDPSVLYLSSMRQNISVAVHNTVSAIENIPAFNHCAADFRMRDVPGGYVCVNGPDDSVYKKIYRSYPLVGQGRESIYSNTDEGTIKVANDLLRGQFDVPRFGPVTFSALPTWSENPYNAGYWRLQFYALRPTLNLLYAFRTTGDVRYAGQLRRLDASFFTAEAKSRWAWVDPHAVAFRSMALVDTWWKLRQGHQLPEGESTTLLRELEKTGTFLADPNRYQIAENHGTNEAAALYEISVAFPTLPHAHKWLELADERLQWQLKEIIDASGQLIENSPFYDFYTLEKYWQIYYYSIIHGQRISAVFDAKLRSMLNFATYILQPNSQVPLLGASLETTINDFGVYAAMASTEPHFLYALTRGAKGTPPPRKSIFFPASNLTVMRSGWPSGAAFTHATYLTYNIGRYRTAHSDLDALGLTLYGDGGDLLPDPGLYTYSPGPYKNYFHGTMSHNTVVVDGKSQFQGTGSAGQLVTKDGVTYQAGESSLYAGVTHQRLVMMLDPDHVLVVDRLRSRSVHTYQQMFHLFPGARLSKSGLTVSGTGGTRRREVTIRQLVPSGITETSTINQRGPKPDGLCSQQYGKLLPCYAISYSATEKNATFETLITIGQPRQSSFSIVAGNDGGHFEIAAGGRHFSVSLGDGPAIAPKAWATDAVAPPVKTSPVAAATRASNWTVSGGILSSRGETHDTSRVITSMSTNSGSLAYLQNEAIRLDLRHHNARFRLKVKGLGRLSELRLQLSNDHWANSVTADVLTAYTPDQAGQWADLFLGPSAEWGAGGGWDASAPGFDWAKIDGLRIELLTRNHGGRSVTVSSAGLTLIPAQKEGKLVFVFDDGYQSILPAASYLHKNGMPGNVAVIGKYVDYPTQDYLNVFQLKMLQNKLGWDMVNHTQQHVDAVRHYDDRHDLTGYAADILQQATWLEANGLNSAPDWFIYPHGSTDAEVESVVASYYMFARVVSNNPEAYPYGDAHAISDLEIQYPGDGESGDIGFTSPSKILTAVQQAVKHHMTLILTFHRIHSRPSDLPGYPLSLFKRVVDGVRDSGIKVMNFSELDRSNGITVRNRIYATAGRHSQITVQIHA